MKPESLRVLILGLNYAPEPTGISPYTAGLAEGLTSAGHSVQVLTGYPHYPEWRLQKTYKGWGCSESINGVAIRRLRHHVPRKPNFLARVHMELSFGARLVFARWGKPDVVLVVSPALLSSAMAILRVRVQRNRPAVGIWVQDLYSRGVVETGGGGILGRVAAMLEATILKSADGVVAIHERFRSYMVNSLGVPEDSVKVIRNWTHVEESRNSGRTNMRSRLGWRSEDIIVLHAGNMGKKQGLENVLKAGRLASERGSRVRFVLMGDGNQRRTLEAMASKSDHVEFVAPLPGDEFVQALTAADLLLVNELPGLKDMAVPSKLTSYFNAGRPVLAATDASSVTAMEIEASGGGVRVNPADPAALLDAAERVGSDEQSTKILGQNGLRFRREKLSADVAIGHYHDFVSSLASQRGR